MGRNPVAQPGRLIFRSYRAFGVSAGDVIVYLKHSYDHVHLDDGREFCVMNVRAVNAVVDGYDEPPAVDERPPAVLESAS